MVKREVGDQYMTRQISDAILNKTKCLFSVQCFDEGNIDICIVNRYFQGNNFFLKTVKQKICTYQRPFVYSHMWPLPCKRRTL
jgi:hypothetical protein